ncbi:MAG TPA: helix-turn-helix domain-containing protein [Thermomicrobiales bacterium]|jgi:TetR/AcrR family transcriptional regulator|nr:helix-turn-helix domain-containing protein [Thermomicrobiales bacterium]
MSASERDNRTAILERAEELFARSGYDGVGVQEIVSAAGVTKPTLYHHFGSKRGLLETLLRERLSPWLSELESAAEWDRDLTGCLTRVARAYVQLARTNPVLYRLHLGLWFGSPDAEATRIVQPYVELQSAILRGLFDAASASHGNMLGRQAAYAASLLGMINARIALADSAGVALDDHDVWLMIQQFSYGIYT